MDVDRCWLSDVPISADESVESNSSTETESDDYINLDLSDIVDEEIEKRGYVPKKKRCKLFETFTKIWVSILMINAIIDMNLSYVLAFLGREQIAETLSIAVVTEIIGVMAVYLIRAFLDTHFEAKDEIEHKKLDVYSLMNNISSSDSEDSEYDEDEEDMDDEYDSTDVIDDAEDAEG